MNEPSLQGRHRITILGCGSSGGVPRFGGPDGRGDWGSCDPLEPRNRRTRCSILVQKAHEIHGFGHSHTTNVIVDTSPDMRAQLLAAECGHLDGVLYTHAHADQSHGIDDLRVFAIAQRRQIPVWIDRATSGELVERFSYCFQQAPGSYYPAILDEHEIPLGDTSFQIEGPAGGVSAQAFLQHHGNVNSLGFRFGDLAYSSDVVDLPEESLETLGGLQVWIVDALQLKPHVSHAHLDLALEWIEQLKPERAILTNLHVTMDYQTLKRQLPENIEPAYDGMQIEL